MFQMILHLLPMILRIVCLEVMSWLVISLTSWSRSDCLLALLSSLKTARATMSPLFSYFGSQGYSKYMQALMGLSQDLDSGHQ